MCTAETVVPSGHTCVREMCLPRTYVYSEYVYPGHTCAERYACTSYILVRVLGNVFAPDKTNLTCWLHLPHRYLTCPRQRQCCWCTGSTGLRDLKRETSTLKCKTTFAWPTTIFFVSIWELHWCQLDEMLWDNWRMKDQLDDTCYFISLIMCSTCFGH